MKDNELMPFEGKEIRKVWHDEQWYFSVIDVIEVLTDSTVPKRYWTDMKKKEPQLYEIIVQLKLKAADGKNYKTDCTNTEGGKITSPPFRQPPNHQPQTPPTTAKPQNPEQG